jgi:hypothetical protein
MSTFGSAIFAPPYWRQQEEQLQRVAFAWRALKSGLRLRPVNQ